MTNLWDTEGIFPGQPAKDPKWEGQRAMLLDIIQAGIEAGMLDDQIENIGHKYNKLHQKPFKDSDVTQMVKNRRGKFSTQK